MRRMKGDIRGMLTKEAASTIRASLSYRRARSLTMIYFIRDFTLNYEAQIVIARTVVLWIYGDVTRSRCIFVNRLFQI